MAADDNHSSQSLVRRAGTDLAVHGQRGAHIVARMVGGALEITRRNDVVPERLYRLGKYELRGPDYRQMLRWAKALACTPEYVLNRLDEATSKVCESSLVEGNCIQSIALDLERLPLESLDWEDGLQLGRLVIFGGCMPRWGGAALPSIKVLELRCATVTGGLDLSPLPRLEELRCSASKLKSLDLSPVPQLTHLWCANNRLTSLDLSAVPKLAELECDGNQLTTLDLSPVTRLTRLDCRRNNLTLLDLSSVRSLTSLCCRNNKLTGLDLSMTRLLTLLDCGKNGLTTLDLSPVPCLTRLDCDGNDLAEIDLSSVPKLDHLECYGNHRLTEIDLRQLDDPDIFVGCGAPLVGVYVRVIRQ